MRFDLLKPKPLTLRRKTNSGSYVKGIWVPAASSDVTISALYYEVMKKHELMFLPEALRTKKCLRIFTNDLIKQKEQIPVAQDADEFTYDGQDYRVIKVEEWNNVSGFSGYQAYALKIDTEVSTVFP